MLTTVILDGPMGKRFGKKWELCVNSPADALRLIEANTPGLKAWMQENIETYSSYRVSCVYPSGRKEDLDELALNAHCSAKVMRFTPVIEGSGNAARIVVGAVIMAAAVWTANGAAFTVGQTIAFNAGASLFLGGVVGLLTPMPQTPTNKEQERLSSHYFSGPANTSQQGNPVQLIYGRVLVGSQVVSAQVDIGEFRVLQNATTPSPPPPPPPPPASNNGVSEPTTIISPYFYTWMYGSADTEEQLKNDIAVYLAGNGHQVRFNSFEMSVFEGRYLILSVQVRDITGAAKTYKYKIKKYARGEQIVHDWESHIFNGNGFSDYYIASHYPDWRHIRALTWADFMAEATSAYLAAYPADNLPIFGAVERRIMEDQGGGSWFRTYEIMNVYPSGEGADPTYVMTTARSG